MSYTNSDVAHRWANQIGTSCRTNNGNMFFEGNTIYSYGYHFPIASFITNDRGVGAILFTEASYSTTTAQHKAEARMAASHRNIIYVPEVQPHGRVYHQKAFEQWHEEIKFIISNELARARKPEKYIFKIQVIVAKAKRYAEFFDLELPESLANVDYSVSEEQIKAIKQRVKEERARKAAWEKEKIDEWLRGERCGALNTKYQYLRVKDGRVETSKNVKIPLELAKKFYERIKDGLLKCGDTILYYRVDSVGDIIKIGCHTFKKSYLLEFGAAL